MEVEYTLDGTHPASAVGTVTEDFKVMAWDKFLEKYPHMAICDAAGTPILMGKQYKEKLTDGKMIGSVRIGRVIVESHPHYAYWLELQHTFVKDDIVTTHPVDPAPDREIYIVNAVIDNHTISVNKMIESPMGKYLRKLTTVAEIMSKVGGDKMADALHEKEVRDKMHELFMGQKLEGKLEDRIIEGYLYTICHEDLTLPQEERKAAGERHTHNFMGKRRVMVQTGKAGIMTYVEIARKNGTPDSVIAESIWLEMVVQNVRMHVNIANLKVNKIEKDEAHTPEEKAGKPEVEPDEENDKPGLGHWNQD